MTFPRLAAALSCSLILHGAVRAQGPERGPSDQAIGQRFEVRAESLPKPYQDPAVRNTALLVPRGDRKPIVPEGFEVTLVAENLEHPRQLLVLPNGDLLVAIQAAGELMLLRDEDGDGRAEWIERYAGGFNGPNGLAYREGEILIADQDGIWRMRYRPGRAVRPISVGPRKAADVPPEQRRPEVMDGQELVSAKGVFGMPVGHANRDIEIGPDGRLYVGVGWSGNIGVEPEPKATIQVFSADGREQRTFASGTRNPVGLGNRGRFPGAQVRAAWRTRSGSGAIFGASGTPSRSPR